MHVSLLRINANIATKCLKFYIQLKFVLSLLFPHLSFSLVLFVVGNRSVKNGCIARYVGQNAYGRDVGIDGSVGEKRFR